MTFTLCLVTVRLYFQQLRPMPIDLVRFYAIFDLADLVLVIKSFFKLRPDRPDDSVKLCTDNLVLNYLALLNCLFGGCNMGLVNTTRTSVITTDNPIIATVLTCLVAPNRGSTLRFVR